MDSQDTDQDNNQVNNQVSKGLILLIDNREREIIKLLESKNVKFTPSQLDIGDIVFKNGDETILVIERKTVPDLKASICDGRGREQKTRLLGTTCKSRIMYLIEGSLDKPLTSKISGLPVSTLVGSLINTQFRDGIKVYKTNSINETVEFICKIYDKLQKDGSTYFKDSGDSGESNNVGITDAAYSSSLKKCKKANMTPRVWFISQLSLIPQVTEKVAEVIVSKYDSLQKIILEYEKTPEHLREKLLADLTFPIANNKVRRIGDKMSARIYNFLYAKEG